MERKKRLLARLAVGAGAVLVLALATLAGVGLSLQEKREGRARQLKQEREQLGERSRKYLGELARRVDALPVDATLLGEIESRYFEEYPNGPMQVWAMDTAGRFLFGVPRETFAKLNAVYDSDVATNLEQGVFVDRQTFLRTLADTSDEIGPKSFAPEPTEDDAEAWSRWRRFGYDAERSLVVSTPLKAPDGTALGSLYLKRSLPGERSGWGEEGPLRGAADVAGVTAALAGAFLWLLLPTWVYVDARGRGTRRAWLFAFLTAISALVGLVVYLISRPETPAVLQCPGCGREVDGGAYCPHCGRDLATAFCTTCRYPLKPDWAFCPACRTEIRPQAPATPPATEAAG